MIDSAPHRTLTVEGLSMDRAPTNLVPYLDCVDGAVAVAGKVCEVTGQPRATIWALFRSGREVGRIELEYQPLRPEVRARPAREVEITRPRDPEGALIIAAWLLTAFLVGATLWTVFS